MPDNDPTPRELMIELRGALSQLDTLARRLDSLTEALAKTYVPRGEYNEARKGDDRRFAEIEGDLDKQAGFRRQVAAGFAVGFLLLLAGIVLSLARVPGVGS